MTISNFQFILDYYLHIFISLILFIRIFKFISIRKKSSDNRLAYDRPMNDNLRIIGIYCTVLYTIVQIHKLN